jgi:hypothetical protein
MKTRLRWFWVAVGALLAVLGEVFLRKLLAVFLCGAFLLNYCLPVAQFGGAAVAQTSQPGVLQSQTGQKIDDYFNPILKDGQPRLGIDRWWATAGVDKEITVKWTVKIGPKDDYYLKLPISKIKKETKIVVLDSLNNVLNTIETPLTPAYSNLRVWRLKKDDKDQDLGGLDKIYTLRIENLSVPIEPVLEEVIFELGTVKTTPVRTDGFGYDYKFNVRYELKTLFIADRPETNSQYLLKIQAADEKIFKTNIPVSKSQLINYFTPILNFEPDEEYQVPFDVNKNTWNAETKANIKDIGNADDYLDLSQFKSNIKATYSWSKQTPAKIYASIVDNNSIDNKQIGIKELAINYYFHYPYSNWYDHNGFNNHEGDWEGITVFLRKDRDGYYYPCRVAFGEHIFFVSESLSEGGEIIEWTRLVKNNNILFSSNSDVFSKYSGSQNGILAQPNVFVSLGGHASYPNAGINELSFCTKFKIPTSNDPRCEEKHRGGKIYNLHDNLSLVTSSEPKSREVVEYLPRVGKGINAKEMQGKEWLLYPGTWGNPKQCKNIFGTCLDAPRGPVFLDLKKISGISQPIAKIDGITWESFGLGERWLNPWKWSETFAGADKIKDCPPPIEEPKADPSPEVFQKPDGSTGSVFGDPHIVTLDGLRNSFQAAGEFILARSIDGNFEVQSRFAPVGKNASLTTAVAVKIGSDRIGIYPGNLLRINGQRSNLLEGSVLSLQGGGRLLRQGNNFTISAPTLEFLQVSGGSSLTVSVTVPKNRRGTIRGLLGNYNGKAEDDLQTRDGRSLPQNASYDQLYKVFGKSWRISQDESLFDYGAGETAATFALLDYPQKVLTLADFSAQQKQEAEKICRSAGVTNAALLESCMFSRRLR